jgi:hypothetical protein
VAILKLRSAGLDYFSLRAGAFLELVLPFRSVHHLHDSDFVFRAVGRPVTVSVVTTLAQPAVIERILKHLKAWDPGPAIIQPSGRDPPLTYHPVPDIA